MRIEITSKRVVEKRPYYVKGDVVTVDDATGRRFVENGWAIDVDGNVQPGKTSGGDLAVDDVTVKAGV